MISIKICTVFDLPDADNDNFYVCEEDIVKVWVRKGRWMIFSICNVEINSFLGIIINVQQTAEKSIVVEMPESGCEK